MTSGGRDLVRAWERFHDDGDVDASVVRPEIAESWKRSRAAGVDATGLDVPYEPDLDLGGSLTACARPVLDQLAGQLDGNAVSVVLTDPDGRLLERRVGESDLRRRLDEISLAPGFSYGEAHAGTNGVGTAVRGGRDATLVVGAEHFTERLRSFACAGAPVYHPLSRRLAGVVDVTCLVSQSGDLMRVLALQAARDIEQSLLDRGGREAQALMATYQAVCARSSHPVVAVGPDVLLTNRVAQARLGPDDLAGLQQRAGEHLCSPSPVTDRMVLREGPVRVTVTPVGREGPGRAAGVVFEVVPGASSLRVLPEVRPGGSTPAARGPRRRRGIDGLAGGSASWCATGEALRAAAHEGLPTLVTGEPGTGKAALLHAVHQEVRPEGRRLVLDGSREVTAALRELADEGSEAGTPTVTVIVRRLESLDEDAVERVAGLLAEPPPGTWVAATAHDGELPATVPAGRLLDRFATTVAVDPLRHRPEDVTPLVHALLDRYASRPVGVTSDALSLLGGACWPGNARELRDVLRRALTGRRSGDLDVTDLPEPLRHGTRRRLSPLETAERDLIVEALLEAGGNRVRAAAALGMGRATLYRRLRAFGITEVGR